MHSIRSTVFVVSSVVLCLLGNSSTAFAQAKSVNITTPAANTNWTAGDTQSITFDYTGCPTGGYFVVTIYRFGHGNDPDYTSGTISGSAGSGERIDYATVPSETPDKMFRCFCVSRCTTRQATSSVYRS